MASASHLKALVQSYVDGDEDRFLSVAMQVAAHEAQLGHGKLATELRETIDEAKRRRGVASLVSISKPRGELANLLQVSQPNARLCDLILDPTLSNQIARVIREQREATKILEQGLLPRRRLLLVGPPGTGKTLTASVLAGELGLPLLRVRLDGLITRFVGETAAKLRQIFDAIDRTRGIYLFDEFDAIGSGRGVANDVGEIRRLVSSFLMMIEQDSSRSLVIAATNHPALLDRAFFRRFDDILHYELPDAQRAAKLLKMRLSSRVAPQVRWESLGREACPLSYAEITRAAEEVLKDVLIRGDEECVEADVRAMLKERKAIAARLPGGAS